MEKYSKGEIAPVRYRTKVCDKTVYDERSEEFTLPDYQPGIRRLLCVDVTPTSPASYVGGGKAEFSGNVNYDVLYSGEDGGLYSARLFSPYGFEATLDAVPDVDSAAGVDAVAYVRADSVTGRVMAPRRLGIRTKLSADVVCYADAEHNERLIGINDLMSVRRLTDTAACARTLHGSIDSLTLGDEIIPEQKDGNIRVIRAGGNLTVNEALAADGCAVCRGDMIMKILFCRESEGDGAQDDVEIMTRKLPFSAEVSMPGCMPGCECRAWGCAKSVNVTVGEGRLICEVEISLDAEATRREELVYTRDIYSLGSPAGTVGSQKELTLPVRSCVGNITNSRVFETAESNIPSGASIVDVSGDADVGEMKCEKGRVTVEGDAVYRVLWRDGEDYGVSELINPWKYELDAPAGIPDGRPDGSAITSMNLCRARMDGERVAVDSEISVALRVCMPYSVEMLDEARFGEPAAPTSSGDMIVCYPAKDDTLWSVSRRYLADAGELAAANAIKVSSSPDAQDTLTGIDYILI